MKKTRSQRGFAPVFVLLVVAMLGILAFVIWKAQNAPKVSNTNNDNLIVQKSTPELKNYSNNDLKFKFSYPKPWGDVKLNTVDYRNKPQQGAGRRISGSFTNNTDLAFGLLSKDFKELGGRDGGCYIYLGSSTDPIRTGIKTGKDGNGEYLVTDLLRTENLVIAEGYEYYSGEALLGSCPGLWIDGATKFPINHEFFGLEAFWLYQDQQNGTNYMPTSTDLANYKKDHNSILSASDRQQVIDFIKSIKVL